MSTHPKQSVTRLVAGYADDHCEVKIIAAGISHSSTRHCALPLNKQGIGIIFIERFFATCFAHRVGPFVIMITSRRELT
jgi:hypothetical protein